MASQAEGQGKGQAEGQNLYLVDGSGYIFRAFFAVRQSLSTASGMPTNALMGFTRMLRSLLEKEHPDHIAVAFDTPAKTFRHEMYDQYKANRPPPPADLVPQFPYFSKIVEAMNIPVLRIEGFEADDLIGTLADRAKREWGVKPIIVTGDKDLMQLVDDVAVMVDPMKDMRYGPEGVIERFGVPPDRVVDVLGLAGDTSDNIPGVPGIGEKTAAKYLQEFGGIEDVLKAAADGKIKGKRGASLVEFADQARLSRDLAAINLDAPVRALSLADLRLTSPDVPKLRALYEELEFTRFIRELDAESGGAAAAAVSKAERGEYKALMTVADVQAAVTEALATAKAGKWIAFDTETTSTDPMQAKLVGVSLSWDAGSGVYIPLAHYYAGVPDQPDTPATLDALRPLLEDPDVPKVAQNFKYDWKVLKRAGLHVRGIAFDPMLASYLLKPGRRSHGLDALAEEFFGHEMIKYAEVTDGVRGAVFSGVAIERAVDYAAEDADFTLQLANLLAPMVAEAGMTSLLDDVELPLAQVLADLEMHGMAVDREHLGRLSVEFEERAGLLEGQIHELAGREFNIGSPKQLRVILFEELGLPVIKKTKTGPSTDMSVLEQLAPKHPLPDRIVQWRHLTKLKSTYVDALPEAIHPETGRVHSSFKQTVAATGRLSSDSPNLQNIPVRTEEGRRIREAFVAPPGHLLLSADYSQIELRILAHLADDPALISAFESGADIHRRTASEIFGVFPEMVGADQRRAAKAINFGVMYGMSAFRLARELDIPRRDAKGYIDRWFKQYAGVRKWLDATLQEAKTKGYVSTLLGRRRFLPDLSTRDHQARARAEREAINSPVQGTAADVLKLAMVAIGGDVRSGKLDAKLVLTVHDELLFEVEDAKIEPIAAQVRQAMEGVVELKVPLTVDVAWGKTWAEAK